MMFEDQPGLTILAISVARGERAGQDSVAFQLRKTGGRDLPVRTVSWTTMNLPADLESACRRHFREPTYSIPLAQRLALIQDLEAVGNVDEPVWLQIDSSSPLLAIVPWERLLQPHLERPVLRLTSQVTSPFTRTGGFNVVLCASSPPALPPSRNPGAPLAETVIRLARALLAPVEREPRSLHVFCDQASDPEWMANVEGAIREATGITAAIHDPARLAASPVVREAVQSGAMPTLTNPWLEWIRNGLGATSVDLLHFCSHGQLSPIEGTLALPTADGASFPVSASDLASFTTQTGAWSIGFTSPAPNYSASGLRMLFDQLIRRQPGIVYLHDLADDPDCVALAGTVDFLAADLRQELPEASPGIALVVSPDRIGLDAETVLDAAGVDQAASVSPHSNTRELIQSSENTPLWVAATQRFLEQTQAQILGEPRDTPEQRAAVAGLEEAVTRISTMLDEHAGHYLASQGSATADAGDRAGDARKAAPS
jgi:hypothetical protein